MFTAVVDRRKRRLWSTRTVALSLGVHLAVLAGIVAAAADFEPPPPPPEPPVVIDTFWLDPATTIPPAPATTSPRQPVPAKRGFVSLPAPETVPDTLPPVDSTARPLTKEDVTGLGQEIVGLRPRGDSTPRPPARDPPLRDFRIDEPLEDAEQPPQLASPRDAQRILERMYPPRLRDGGVTGRTMVVLVVDGTGAVVPGSVTVRETSHEGFRDAAIRAAERFRFRPATRNGQPYAAFVSLPIEWKILR